jgi:hypothetical protein
MIEERLAELSCIANEGAAALQKVKISSLWFGLVHGLIDSLLECPPGTHGVSKLREGTSKKNRGTNLKTPWVPGGLECPLGSLSPRRCLPIVQKKFSGQAPCQFDLI